MTRDQFSAEFVRGLRFVLQKHEREIDARKIVQAAGGQGWSRRADIALEHATTMTDAAIMQVADHFYDLHDARSAQPA